VTPSAVAHTRRLVAIVFADVEARMNQYMAVGEYRAQVANAAAFGIPTATSAPATVKKLSRKKRRRLVGRKQSCASQSS